MISRKDLKQNLGIWKPIILKHLDMNTHTTTYKGRVKNQNIFNISYHFLNMSFVPEYV